MTVSWAWVPHNHQVVLHMEFSDAGAVKCFQDVKTMVFPNHNFPMFQFLESFTPKQWLGLATSHIYQVPFNPPVN